MSISIPVDNSSWTIEILTGFLNNRVSALKYLFHNKFSDVIDI